jgi:hypothetical protein
LSIHGLGESGLRAGGAGRRFHVKHFGTATLRTSRSPDLQRDRAGLGGSESGEPLTFTALMAVRISTSGKEIPDNKYIILYKGLYCTMKMFHVKHLESSPISDFF